MPELINPQKNKFFLCHKTFWIDMIFENQYGLSTKKIIW